MTTVAMPLRRPLSHRAAVRLGHALTAWGSRQPATHADHATRVAAIEHTRDSAARLLPQLPR